MAGCIEDLFTQYLWDFDRLKGLHCSPMEERFQDFAHGCYLLCCKYNIEMLRAQHTKCNTGAGSILRYSENDSGPEKKLGRKDGSITGKQLFVDSGQPSSSRAARAEDAHTAANRCK